MDNTQLFPELLQQLQNNDPKAIEQLYRTAYPYVANFILNNDGTTHDARRCFRKALTIFFRQLVENQVSTDIELVTYLYALSRAVWLMELSRRNKQPLDLNTSSPSQNLPAIPDTLLQSATLPEPPSAEMMEALDAMHPDHKKFLMAYYFYKVPLHVLAEQLDYSESFVRVKKRRCLDELRRLLDGLPPLEEANS